MSMRRRGLAILAALALVLGIAGAVVLVRHSSDDEPDRTSAFDPSVPRSSQTPPPAAPTDDPSDDQPGDGSTASATPSKSADPSAPGTGADPSASPSTLTPQVQAEIAAETSPVVDDVLDETAEIDPSEPVDVVGDLSDRVSQAFLSELEAERLEFEAEGWSRTGSYSLEDLEVTDLSSTGDTEVATVQVCIDSTGLVTRRSDGEVVPTSLNSGRAWNIFVLERSDSAEWRIVGRTFPNDPAC